MSSGMRTVTYPIPGFPTVRLTEQGDQFGVRPMLPEDGTALQEFFGRVPAADRFYLKEDVTSERVIAGWMENLDYGRALPLLAIKDDKIIGDGTLHHSRSEARRHVAEVRVVVDPDYRNQGIGRGLLRCLAEVAKQRDVEKLRFEIVAGTEEAARHAAQLVGFIPVAVLHGHIRDIDGTSRDLVIMELTVSDAVPSEEGIL